MTIQPASPDDLEPVQDLLRTVGLPHDDLTPAHLEHVLVARGDDTLHGVVGLEPWGEVALLRSLAVVPNARGQGLGTRLVEAIEQRARQEGIRTLYLLTTTAASYFQARGYEHVERDALPRAIQQTDEAARLCPDSALCMRKSVHALDDAPWRPFVDGLRRFIAGRVPESDAEDILQDTLLRLHEASGSLREADRAEAWVFSIARRTIADFYRGRERGPDVEPVGRTPAEAIDEPPATENLSGYDGAHDVHEEVLSWLRPMAEDLPEKYRRPLVMADFEGTTHQDVADELGLTRSGATSRIRRARAKLRERLRRCCEVEFRPEGQAVAFRRREERCETCHS